MPRPIAQGDDGGGGMLMARFDGSTIFRWVVACVAVAAVALMVVDAWLLGLVMASVLLAVGVRRSGD
ncbi:MAG: hypothetical protein ACREUU_12465 [Gammaproteobacteria bacterium]